MNTIKISGKVVKLDKVKNNDYYLKHNYNKNIYKEAA